MDYEWFALERIECTTPKLKGPGGQVAKWTACQNRKPAVLGLSAALTTCWICYWLSQIHPFAMFVNSQLAYQSSYIFF